MKNFIIFLILFRNFIVFLHADSNISYSTQVQPTSFSTNEQAYLIVTANKIVNSATFELPSSTDFRLRYESQSSQTRYINGTLEQSTSWFFQITAYREGTFSIPDFRGTSQGKTFHIPGTTFTVTKTVASPSNVQQNAVANTIVLNLSCEFPQKWYVGQSVPAQIQLITPPHLRGQLSSYPQKIGDTFSASRLIENPQQTVFSSQGQKFSCVYWPTLLTALTSGNVTLSFSIDIEIERPAQTKGFFDNDDPLNLLTQGLNSMFLKMESATLKSTPKNINILPLPQPQPNDFNQAIGNFQLASPSIVETEFIQNEPITFLVKIAGTGNFENIHAPKLLSDEKQWRIYNPTSNFEAKDLLGFEGELTYKYMLVPLVSGNLQLPKVSFSFFDPKRGEYENLLRSFPSSAIQVKPALHSNAPTPITSSQNVTDEIKTPPHFDNNIFIDKITWNEGFSTFKSIQLILFISTAIFFIVALRHYYITHSVTYEQNKYYKKQIHNAYKDLSTAFKSQKGLDFYSALYQLIDIALKNKGVSLANVLNGQALNLTDNEKILLQKIENIYQESKFGQSYVECPQDMSLFKNLINTLK